MFKWSIRTSMQNKKIVNCKFFCQINFYIEYQNVLSILEVYLKIENLEFMTEKSLLKVSSALINKNSTCLESARDVFHFANLLFLKLLALRIEFAKNFNFVLIFQLSVQKFNQFFPIAQSCPKMLLLFSETPRYCCLHC